MDGPPRAVVDRLFREAWRRRDTARWREVFCPVATRVSGAERPGVGFAGRSFPGVAAASVPTSKRRALDRFASNLASVVKNVLDVQTRTTPLPAAPTSTATILVHEHGSHWPDHEALAGAEAHVGESTTRWGNVPGLVVIAQHADELFEALCARVEHRIDQLRASRTAITRVWLACGQACDHASNRAREAMALAIAIRMVEVGGGEVIVDAGPALGALASLQLAAAIHMACHVPPVSERGASANAERPTEEGASSERISETSLAVTLHLDPAPAGAVMT